MLPLAPSSPGWQGALFTQGLQPQGPTIILRLTGVPVPALLDSGSAITLAGPSALTSTSQPCGNLVITWVHGDVREVPAPEVQKGG